MDILQLPKYAFAFQIDLQHGSGECLGLNVVVVIVVIVGIVVVVVVVVVVAAVVKKLFG